MVVFQTECSIARPATAAFATLHPSDLVHGASQDFEECVGGCSGVDTNKLSHEFHTTLAKSELSTDTIGEDGMLNSNSNCTVKSSQILVDLFEGGESFRVFASRIRVRSKTAVSSNTLTEEQIRWTPDGVFTVHMQVA